MSQALPQLTPFQPGGVVCLPFCTCLIQPRHAVKRRSLPGALHYIAHGFLCTAMVTGVACAFLLRNHDTWEHSRRWQDVDAGKPEQAAGFLFDEALQLAYPLLFLSPLITAGAVAFFALHIRASPIVYTWSCPPSLLLSAAIHLACSLIPLPTLLHEAALQHTAWASQPSVGEVWTSAARLDKATVFFTTAGWALLLLVWAMAYLSRRWAAEPHFESIDEWVVTEEDGREETRGTVGEPEGEDKEEAALPSRSPLQRRSRRIEAARASPVDLPDTVPDGPKSFHIRRKLVPLQQGRLEVFRTCSDPAMLTATVLILLAVAAIAFSFSSYDVIAWRQQAVVSNHSAHSGEWLDIRLGWVSGTNASSSSPFAQHPWSRLHLCDFRHSHAMLGRLVLLSTVLPFIGWVAVWLRLSYSHADDGYFHLTGQASPALEGCVLLLWDCACNAASQLLAWKEWEGLKEEQLLEGRENVRLSWGAELWLAAAACRVLAAAIVAARMWRDHRRWLRRRKGSGQHRPRAENGKTGQHARKHAEADAAASHAAASHAADD